MSGTVDASIPLQAKPPQQPNPLQTIGEFANLQNALNQNKLFPGQLQLQGQQVQSGQANLTQLHRQLGAASLAPLLSDPEPLTLSKVTSALGGAENGGVITQPILQSITSLPLTGDAQNDNRVLRSFILANSQPPASAANAVTPAQVNVNQGPNIQPYLRGAPGMPDQGVMKPVGAPIGLDLSPAERATPTQTGVTPQGAPIRGTLGQFRELTGDVPGVLGTGRLPPSLRGNLPAPGVVSGIGPSQEAAMQTAGAGSGKAFLDIADQGNQATTQKSILGNMLADAQSFAPGPEKINEFKATLQRYAPSIANTFGIDPNSVSANESFDKLASQIASQVGDRSDASLAIAKKANPGSYLSPAGVDMVIRNLQGFADYNKARADAATAWTRATGRVDDRPGFEADVGSKLDPRAFQFARMTPQQRLQYVNQLGGEKTKDYNDVRSSYNYAVQRGLISNAGQ